MNGSFKVLEAIKNYTLSSVWYVVASHICCRCSVSFIVCRSDIFHINMCSSWCVPLLWTSWFLDLSFENHAVPGRQESRKIKSRATQWIARIWIWIVRFYFFKSRGTLASEVTDLSVRCVFFFDFKEVMKNILNFQTRWCRSCFISSERPRGIDSTSLKHILQPVIWKV